MGKKVKRFFPSVRKEGPGLPTGEGQKAQKRKSGSRAEGSGIGGDGGESREQLEARLEMLQKKVEEFRAPEKKAARARVFRSIGKVHQSLRALEARGADVHEGASGSDTNGGCNLSQIERPAKKAKKAKGTVAEAPSSPRAPSAAPTASKETRRKIKQRLQLLNKQIVIHGQRKQLTKALCVYEQIISEGLTPSDYTHTNLINAFVRSGDIQGAMQQLVAMQDAGATPNVVTYTALIKGVCSAGDMKGAEELLARMGEQRPPLLPNLRTINTLLRGCVRVGDVNLGHKIVRRMREDWGLEPDGPCVDYMVKLLTQGLRMDEAREVLNTCAESGSGQAFVSLAFAAALTGDVELARKGIAAFRDLPPVQDDGAGGRGDGKDGAEGEADGVRGGGGGREGQIDARASVALFRSHQRSELEREVELVEVFLNDTADGAADAGGSRARGSELLACLLRTFPLDSTLASPSACQAEERGEEVEGGGGETAERVLLALDASFGLTQLLALLRQGGGGGGGEGKQGWTRKKVEKRVRKLVAGGLFQWDRVFDVGAVQGEEAAKTEEGSRRREELPVKMEICSGTGDWVVAQAKADTGRANWVSLELRHDRVHQTMTKMALHRARNLACIAGDANKVLAKHVPPASLAQVVINFPEPPLWSGGDGESNFHLLTPEFFKLVHAALQKKGTLCILSDNVRYSVNVARTLAELSFAGGGGSKDGKQCFRNAKLSSVKHT